MFYAHFVLSKKGPLARIWLAAHWDKKLTKAHVFETNIDSSVEAIIQPKVKMALRTSGHLLLGVVRIYSRKAKYLLADCNEAFLKIKMAFRPGIVDLPEENREAALATITLQENFHDFDSAMADLSDIDVQAQYSVNQSRPEEITMREDLGNITFDGDDGFGDMAFDDSLYKNTDTNILDGSSTAETTIPEPPPMDFDLPKDSSDFGAGLAQEFEEPAGAAGDSDHDDNDEDDNFGGEVDDQIFEENFIDQGGLFVDHFNAPPAENTESEKPPSPVDEPDAVEKLPPVTEQSTVIPDQTTLLPNEVEAFALEPLDVTTVGTERKVRRKRKLVVDDQKGIASETMKLQLSDTGDIVTTLDLAPPTKKLMLWKETGGVEKLFALPARCMHNKRLYGYFQRCLVTRPIRDDDIEESEQEQMQFGLTNIESELDIHVPPSIQDPPSVQDPPIVPDPPSVQAPPILPAPILLAPPVLAPPVLAPPAPVPPIAASPTVQNSSNVHDSSEVAELKRRDTATIDRSSIMELPSINSTQNDVNNESSRLIELPPINSPGSPDDHDDGDMNFDSPSVDSLPPIDDNDDEPISPQSDHENEGEVDDEEDEKRWSKRSQFMMHLLERRFSKDADTVSFQSLLSRNNRKQVASKFYTLLVLKKIQAITVEQAHPYGDIFIGRGPQYGMASAY